MKDGAGGQLGSHRRKQEAPTSQATTACGRSTPEGSSEAWPRLQQEADFRSSKALSREIYMRTRQRQSRSRGEPTQRTPLSAEPLD